MLLLLEEIVGTNRVIFPTSLIGKVIEEEPQRPETAQAGAKKVMDRLVHSYYCPGMKKDVQLQLHPSLPETNYTILPSGNARS